MSIECASSCFTNPLTDVFPQRPATTLGAEYFVKENQWISFPDSLLAGKDYRIIRKEDVPTLNSCWKRIVTIEDSAHQHFDWVSEMSLVQDPLFPNYVTFLFSNNVTNIPVKLIRIASAAEVAKIDLVNSIAHVLPVENIPELVLNYFTK